MSDQSGAITPWRANILSPVYLVHTHMQPAARFASRCTCATAAQVHRASIAPPLPLFRPIARRQSYHSRRVSRHACESPPSLHIRSTHARASVCAHNTDTCSVLPVCAIPPMRRMQHSYGFVRAKACSSQRAAVQRARCIASFLDARRAFDRSRSSRRVWVTKKRKRKKEEEEEVFYVCSKDKKVLWLR